MKKPRHFRHRFDAGKIEPKLCQLEVKFVFTNIVTNKPIAQYQKITLFLYSRVHLLTTSTIS